MMERSKYRSFANTCREYQWDPGYLSACHLFRWSTVCVYYRPSRLDVVLEHEDAVVDFERRTQFDVHDFDDVRLIQEQERFAVNLLELKKNEKCRWRSREHEFANLWLPSNSTTLYITCRLPHPERLFLVRDIQVARKQNPPPRPSPIWPPVHRVWRLPPGGVYCAAPSRAGNLCWVFGPQPTGTLTGGCHYAGCSLGLRSGTNSLSWIE